MMDPKRDTFGKVDHIIDKQIHRVARAALFFHCDLIASWLETDKSANTRPKEDDEKLSDLNLDNLQRSICAYAQLVQQDTNASPKTWIDFRCTLKG